MIRYLKNIALTTMRNVILLLKDQFLLEEYIGIRSETRVCKYL